MSRNGTHCGSFEGFAESLKIALRESGIALTEAHGRNRSGFREKRNATAVEVQWSNEQSTGCADSDTVGEH